MMMAEDETYNGFTNRETWAVKLHIDNNQSWHEHSLKLAEQARTEAVEGTYIGDGGYVIYRYAKNILADQLKEWVEELVSDFWWSMEKGYRFGGVKNQALMIQDVGSFWRVDWHDIARTLLEDYQDIEG